MTALITWGNLLPKGPDLTARDGRRWSYNPAEVITTFAANQGPLAVDYEHAQDRLPKGEQAPAAGWIVAMEERDGALWGKIEWTERAANMVREREYRFLSASMQIVDGRIIGLHGAGLVNRPSLPVQPLDAEQPGEIEREARALASKAQVYQTEQAALGRSITISEAVTTVAAMSAGRAAF